MSNAIKPGFKTRNGYAPADGPKCLPIELDFTTESVIAINLYNENTTNEIDFVQAMFADNADNPNALVITINVTGHRLVIPPHSQGVYPVFGGTPLAFTAATTPGVISKVTCLNTPVPWAEWYTQFAGPANVALPPYTGTYADQSGTIAVGGASQVVMPLNLTRKQFIISNPSYNTNLESIFINFNGAAQVGVDSIEIPPGATYNSNGGPCTTQAITIIAATGGTNFVAKEM